MYLPTYTSLMPLHANMLGICPSSPKKAWTYQRIGIGYMANTEMQPLGGQRIRPSALKLNA